MMFDVEAASAPAAAPAAETSPEPSQPGSEPQNAPDPAAPQSEPNGEGERDENGRYLSREAASYRRRLRDTETERDQLRERLDRLQTAEVERLASGAGLAVPGDVWTFGATLDTLRGEDGMIDAETVSGVVQEIVNDRPGLKALPVGGFGGGQGAAATPSRTSKVGLSQLLKPEAR
jgi:hypothetical protein